MSTDTGAGMGIGTSIDVDSAARPAPAAPSPLARAGSGLGAYRHEVMLGILLAALLGTAAVLSPGFLSPGTQRDLLSQSWELAILTVPMMLIILTGGIDLSVGSTMALAAVVFGVAFQRHAGVAVAACSAVAAGAACGLANGVCITRLRIHPLIVTLATLSAYRGIAEGVSLGRPVSGFPDEFNRAATGAVLGLQLPGWVYVVACVAAAVVLARTPWGKALVAMGYNETAARFSAVPVDRIKLALYTLSGTAAGLAAVVFAARRNTAKADVGVGMELDVITAVVLGGTSIFGGRGTVLGTVLGFLLLHESREWMSWAFDRDELNLILIGSLLVVSVLLQRVLSRPARGEE